MLACQEMGALAYQEGQSGKEVDAEQTHWQNQSRVPAGAFAPH